MFNAYVLNSDFQDIRAKERRKADKEEYQRKAAYLDLREKKGGSSSKEKKDKDSSKSSKHRDSSKDKDSKQRDSNSKHKDKDRSSKHKDGSSKEKKGNLYFINNFLTRVPTKTGKMGRHFLVRENNTKYWKSQEFQTNVNYYL